MILFSLYLDFCYERALKNRIEDLEDEIEDLRDQLEAKDELIDLLKQNKGKIPRDDEC